MCVPLVLYDMAWNERECLNRLYGTFEARAPSDETITPGAQIDI